MMDTVDINKLMDSMRTEEQAAISQCVRGAFESYKAGSLSLDQAENEILKIFVEG
jgi:hypothetical protein